MDTYMNTVGHVEKNAQRGSSRQVARLRRLTRREKATGQVSCTASPSGLARSTSGSRQTAIVQGSATWLARLALARKLGVSTIAVGDHSGYLRNHEGFNPHKLAEHVRQTGAIAGTKRVSRVRAKNFLPPGRPFHPAALETRWASRRPRP